MLEVIVLALIFILSLLLIFGNFKLSISVLLVLSVFLHKEVFSIYRWDLLPVRFFMLSLGIYGGFELLKWLYATRDLKKILAELRDPFVLLLVLIWIIRGISILFTKNLSASIFLFGFFSTVVVLGILMYKHYRGRPEEVLALIKKYIVVAFGLVLFGFFQIYLYNMHGIIIGALWNIPGHIARIGSTFWDVNHFAALLASLLPILGVLILTEGPIKKRVWRSFMFITMTVMLLLTSSRTSWIIALVSFLVFLTLLLIKYLGKKGVAGLFVVLMLALSLFLLEYSDKASPMRKYVKDNFHYRLDSFASHIMLLQGSYQIFEEYPILGGGYGGFFEHFRKTDISAEFFGRDPAALNTRVPPHTIWGEQLAETGIIGLTFFILFVSLLLFTMLYGFFKSKERKSSLMSGAMFATLTGILTAGIFYSYNSEFFWLILFMYFMYSLSVLPKGTTYSDVFTHFLKRDKFYLSVVVLLASLFIFVKLGVNHLIPWDEAIYAKIAKTMIAKGEYINMFWRKDIIWFEKPPLYMWLMAAFMHVLGVTSLAARLPSAIFGFGTVILTFIIAKKLFGKFAGYLSALALLLGVHFLYYSRAAMTDVTTTFFVTLTMFLFLVVIEKNKKYLWLLMGFTTGFALMTKGVIGSLPFVIVGIYELLSKWNLKELFSWKNFSNYLLMFTGAMVIASPWHIIMYLRYGQAFIDSYFLYHVVSRATMAIENKGQPFFWYVTVMKVSMRIWFIPLIAAVPYFLTRATKKSAKYMLFSIWFFTVFFILSSASSKIIWYIMPIYPAAAIMVGGFLEEAFVWFMKKLKIGITELMRAGILFFVTVLALMYFFFNRHLVYTSDLTGAPSDLLTLKDEKLGTDDMVYVDRVSEPVVMFYTDGPYDIIDFEPSKGRFPLQTYDKRVIVIAKNGRFTSSSEYYGRAPEVIAVEGDYTLFFYESDINYDKDRIKVVQNTLKSLQKDPYANAEEIDELKQEYSDIKDRMAPFVDL